MGHTCFASLSVMVFPDDMIGGDGVGLVLSSLAVNSSLLQLDLCSMWPSHLQRWFSRTLDGSKKARPKIVKAVCGFG